MFTLKKSTNRRRVALLAAAAMGLAVAGSAGARAEGFLGGLINKVAPGVGTQLDRMNHNLGNPVDRAFTRGLDTVVPGAGTAMELNWEMQRSGVLGRPGGPAQPGGAAMGNYCSTPAGRFGPGPVNPVGTPCHAAMPHGTFFGQVTQ